VYVSIVGYMLWKLAFITRVMVSWLIRDVGSSRYLVQLGNEKYFLFLFRFNLITDFLFCLPPKYCH